jgi:hypothetical protein
MVGSMVCEGILYAWTTNTLKKRCAHEKSNKHEANTPIDLEKDISNLVLIINTATARAAIIIKAPMIEPINPNTLKNAYSSDATKDNMKNSILIMMLFLKLTL